MGTYINIIIPINYILTSTEIVAIRHLYNNYIIIIVILDVKIYKA